MSNMTPEEPKNWLSKVERDAYISKLREKYAEKWLTEIQELRTFALGIEKMLTLPDHVSIDGHERLGHILCSIKDGVARQTAEIASLKAQLAEAQKAIQHVRPKVLQFAQAMERKLRANEHKGGWEDCSTDWLWDRMREESNELLKAVGADVLGEAADVANFAMMIADNCGLLAAAPTYKKED